MAPGYMVAPDLPRVLINQAYGFRLRNAPEYRVTFPRLSTPPPDKQPWAAAQSTQQQFEAFLSFYSFYDNVP